MSAEPSPTRRLAAVVIAAVLSAGVPAAVVARIQALRAHTPLTVIAIILYELLLAMAGFALAVSADLRSRWQSRVTDAVDAWLRRKMSRYTRVYLRYIRAFTRYMD